MRRAPLEMSRDEFRLLRDLLCAHSGFRIADGREAMLENRLQQRAVKTGSRSFLDYYRLLKYGDGVELQTAIDAVVNNETYFFRERSQLEDIVSIALQSKEGSTFSVLSAGCSTGEEPYSLAMLFDEAGAERRGIRVRIAAVDISATAVAAARSARYGAHSFRGVERRYVDRYFTFADDRHILRDEIRANVSFHHASLVEPGSLKELGRFDAVLCRNVTIYFGTEDKRRASDNLASALAPCGRLYMGHSESLYNTATGLTTERRPGGICYRMAGCEEMGQAV